MLDPYSDYVGSTSLLITPPRSHFLMCIPPYSLLTDGWQNRLFFSLHSSLLQKSSFWWTSTAITPSKTPKVLPTPAGRKYSTGSSPVTSSSSSMTLTHPPLYIAPLLVAPLLTSPLLPPLWPFLVSGRCFRTWVLTTYQFFYLSLSLVFHPNKRPPSLNFQKVRWDDFVSYFDSHCPAAEEYSSLSSAAALFYLSGTECGQIFPSFRPHQTSSYSLVVC